MFCQMFIYKMAHLSVFTDFTIICENKKSEGCPDFLTELLSCNYILIFHNRCYLDEDYSFFDFAIAASAAPITALRNPVFRS